MIFSPFFLPGDPLFTKKSAPELRFREVKFTKEQAQLRSWVQAVELWLSQAKVMDRRVRARTGTDGATANDDEWVSWGGFWGCGNSPASNFPKCLGLLFGEANLDLGLAWGYPLGRRLDLGLPWG